MNIVPNGDSVQCPESKLGQVHSVHTHGPWLLARCECIVPRPTVSHRVVARTGVISWPCRKHVATRTSTIARHVATPLNHNTSLYRNTALCRTLCQARTAPYRSLYRYPYCDTNAAPSHNTIFVSRHSPLARPPAHALGCIACTARRIVAHAWQCRDRALAVSWPIPCAPMPAVSQYSLPYRDQAQNGQ